MFQLCFNTNGLRNHPLTTAISLIRGTGYDAVEISLHDSHLHPLKASPEQVDEVRRTLKGEGIRAACLATGAGDLLGPVNHEPSLICPDPTGRRRRIDLLRAAIDVAQRLAIPVVNCPSGFLREGVDTGEATHWLVEGIRQVLEGSGEITLAVEPEPGMFVGTTTQAAAVIAQVDDHRFRMNPDIGHIRCVEDDFLGAIERSVPVATHFHVEDIRERVHFHLIPGEGDIEFANVFGVLAKAGYQGAVSVELYTQTQRWREALERSLVVLETARAAACAAGVGAA